MSQILLAIDGPSPNVGSGLTPPYGVPTTTEDGISQGGTGAGLGTSGIAGGTMVDATISTNPSNRTAYAEDSMSPNVESGLPAGQYPPNSEATVLGSPQGTLGSGTSGVTAQTTAAVPTGESV